MTGKIKNKYPALRWVITLAVMLLVCWIITFQATSAEPLATEDGAIEIAEHMYLILMCGISGLAAWLLPSWRMAFGLLGSITGMMLIREQNNWFKAELFDGAWQLCVLAVLIPSAIWLGKQRAALYQQLRQIYRTQPFGLAVTGMLLLLVFSRLLGRKAIWQGVMGEQFNYGVKMFVEESLELLGYGLILAALLQLILILVAHQRSAH